MRWWGWGDDEHGGGLPASADGFLREEIGAEPGDPRPHVPLEQVRLPEPALDARVRDALAAVVGEGGLTQDHAARVQHAAGRSYPDLVRLRSGDGLAGPDAVLLPRTAEQVRAVLEICAREGVAIVPFGGGTSVVGGVEPLRGGFGAVISLDLAGLDRVLDVDRRSLTATLEGGLFGPAAEARLGEQGLTLGHFPQSFEFSTVGGWVATRSAGQASTGYGRIDELVEAVTLAAPAGDLTTLAVPGTAAGPQLREAVVGSEGVLGVITAATLRVRPAPEQRRYEGWSFRDFEEGVEAFRVMEQADASPDVARLSDRAETRMSLALASTGSRTERLGRAYLRARGHEGGCLAIIGLDGEPDDVERRRVRTAALLRAGGGLSLGARPGEAWLRGRFAAPYLRDHLLDRSVMVETLETATTWSNVDRLYAAVGGALRDSLGARGTPPLVMCHVSHLYRSGASLYFT
ncbi:MAG: FAD-binding oxidoreductase, partial [Thermoleophilaceae bacterium]|nr:FAD-binding oxidoreductase [Thermoleophilaceae bacterium]